jgi:hypothetical protein
MDLFSFLSFHFMCVTVTVVTGHSVALNRRSHLFSTMSSLHDVLVHDTIVIHIILLVVYHSHYCNLKSHQLFNIKLILKKTHVFETMFKLRIYS